MPALIDVEMPLVPVLAQMEAVGIAVNPLVLERLKVHTTIWHTALDYQDYRALCAGLLIICAPERLAATAIRSPDTEHSSRTMALGTQK